MPALQLARGLLRSPALTIAATLCTAIGVAATTAVATLANAVMLRPVPFPNPDRLVRIWLDESGVDPRLSLSIPESRELRELTVFDDVLATARVRTVAVLRDGAERARGEGVDRGYFERLGLSAHAGRLLQPEDHRPSSPPIVVISHSLWARAYGMSASAIGSTYRTQRASYTIVGVAPRGFRGTVEDDDVEFWLPIEHYEPQSMIQDPDARQTWVIGSLRPGATLADAEAAVAARMQEWKARDPRRYRNLALRAEPFGASWRTGLQRGTVLLGIASSLLLVIAALNAGCLLLARVLDRRRELAIRRALGASQGRLLRQLIAEALLLCAGGGLLGIVLGPAMLDSLLTLSPITLPSYVRVEPDARVAIASAIVLVLCGLIAGTAPALTGSAARPADALQAGSRGVVGRARDRRWIPILIAAEVAGTLVILFAGALLLRTFDRFASYDLGFRREGIARLAITLSRDDAGPVASREAVFERLVEATAATPGVTAAGLVTPTLPPWDSQRGRVAFAEIAAMADGQGLPAGVHLIDPGLLPTLEIAVGAGRNFNKGESDAVAIISRSIAARMGGEEAAIGRTVTLAGEAPSDPAGTFRIVGVAADVGWDGFGEQGARRIIQYDDPTDPLARRWDIYLPLARYPVTTVSIAAATSGDAGPIIDAVRQTLSRVAPGSAVHWTSTMESEIALEYAPSRFYTVLVGAFSFSALLLTSVGLFALLWHTAVARMGEMGLRLALGAKRRAVAWLVVASAAKPLVAGAAAGLLGALWIGDWMQGFLYGVAPFDVTSLFAAACGMLVAAGVAAFLPARRAASVDPIVALRSE